MNLIVQVQGKRILIPMEGELTNPAWESSEEMMDDWPNYSLSDSDDEEGS